MIGRILGERYEILAKIGDGGMALVYRARDLQEKRTVAVKVLRPEHVSDEDFIRRFRREAEASGRLKHSHLVELYDISVNSEPYYIVMEFVEGVTLHHIIAHDQQMDFERVMYIALQINDALQYAHENQIIHRDIKPQNVLVSVDDFVKVTDFGIAVLVSASTIVNTRSIMGSVHYFSPEQARGDPVNEQSDLYSLGVVLYEMIAGQVPFDGDSSVAIALKHVQDEPQPLSELRPDVPGSLEDIVMRLLEKDARKRYQSAEELRLSLEAVVEELPELANSSLLERVRRSLGKQDRNLHRQRQQRRMMRGLISLLLVACVLFGLAYGAWQFLFPPRPETNRMPKVSGLLIEKAAEELSAAGFPYRIAEIVYDNSEPGTVISQDRQAEAQIIVGTEVGLVVSAGRELFNVPKVTGLSKQQADLQMQGKLKPIYSYVSSDTVAEGYVISQEPAPETPVSGETTVQLVISSGPEKVVMPVVIGMTFEEAKEKLLELGLRPPDAPKVRSEPTFPAGRIIEQNPVPNDLIAKNSKVELVLNSTQTLAKFTVTFEDEPAVQKIRVEVEDASLTNPQRVVFEEEFRAGSAPKQMEFYIEIPGVVRVYRNDVLIDTLPYR